MKPLVLFVLFVALTACATRTHNDVSQLYHVRKADSVGAVSAAVSLCGGPIKIVLVQYKRAWRGQQPELTYRCETANRPGVDPAYVDGKIAEMSDIQNRLLRDGATDYRRIDSRIEIKGGDQ